MLGESPDEASLYSETYDQAGTTVAESLTFSLDPNKTAEPSSSDLLMTATAFAQSSTAEELVETLNAAQPPPTSETSVVHLVVEEPLVADSALFLASFSGTGTAVIARRWSSPNR